MELVRATQNDLQDLLNLVRAYHAFENIERSDEERTQALLPLLSDNAREGGVWLVHESGQAIGYIALCFGYSIELGGRDAFIDELFVAESHRGHGIGSAVLDAIKEIARESGIRALHLEVARNNARARSIYATKGFESRDKYHLMTRMLRG